MPRHKRTDVYYENPFKNGFYDKAQSLSKETRRPGSGRTDFHWNTLRERQDEMKARMLYEKRLRMLSGLFFRMNGVWAEEEGLNPSDFFTWNGVPAELVDVE